MLQVVTEMNILFCLVAGCCRFTFSKQKEPLDVIGTAKLWQFWNARNNCNVLLACVKRTFYGREHDELSEDGCEPSVKADSI